MAAVMMVAVNAQRAIDRADAGTHRATNDGTDGTGRMAAFMCALFGAADETLRLGNHRKRQGGAKTRDGNYRQSHYFLLVDHFVTRYANACRRV
jgi:hypothetical protein